MKKVLLSLFLAFIALPALSAQFKEGVHYEVIKDAPRTEKPEVREFYSYLCGHCYSMQDTFHEIQKNYPQEFVTNPIPTLGGELGAELQKAFAVAKVLGIEEKFNDDLFKNIHYYNSIPQNRQDILGFFESIGVDPKTASRTFGSFVVIGYTSNWDKHMNDAKIDAVPELVVNGVYKVKLSTFKNRRERLNQLIGYLLTKKD